jgi:2-aminoadipate transaminase
MHAPNTVKPLPLGLSARAVRTHESPISFLIATALRNPGLINLAAGLVDPSTLPVEAVSDAAQRVLHDSKRAREALQYDTTIGLTGLRQEALRRIEKLESVLAAEMNLTPDSIVVTTGSQQALFLVGDVLIDPGDIVIAAAPSYFVFTGALDSLGATILSVPMDDDGMDVAAVGRLLERVESEGRLSRVKFVYCTSYFQNPTGLTLSAERRPKLLQIVKRFSKDHRILILEDAAYRELRYGGPAHRSIKSYDTENRYTVLSQTFSKPFAPGLKLGYSAMPPDLLNAVLHEKGSHDFGSSSLTQHLALEAMRDGHYDRQVERLCKGYSSKRDTVLASLKKFMPKNPAIQWTHPSGGLYVWLTLPKSIDTSRAGKMFALCVDRGVLYVPGDYCFQADTHCNKPMNHIRLSFGQVDAAKIEPGIEILAGVVRELLENAAS